MTTSYPDPERELETTEEERVVEREFELPDESVDEEAPEDQ